MMRTGSLRAGSMRAGGMRAGIALLACAQVGCAGLVHRPDDSALARNAKISTRLLLAVPSLGVSELLVRRHDPREGLCDTWCGTAQFVPAEPAADAGAARP